jgi:hypothetical protein
VWIAHTGRNLNKSNFSKAVLEGMIDTLPNTPIVGFVETNSANKEDFKGHEERYIITVDGVEIEYLGRMYGIIPETHNARFEKKTVDGVEREYLVADGLLYNKFSKAKEIFDRDSSKSQSMELDRETLEGYFDKNADEFVFTNAEFEALCILGDRHAPAMVGGLLEKIQFKAFKYELKELVEEIKHEVELELKFEKGGLKLGEKLKELIGNYSLVSEEFVAELEGKIDTYETEEQLVETLETEQARQFSLTMRAESEVLSKALNSIEQIGSDDWSYSRYSYRDHNPETGEVYASDYRNWSDVGFKFAKDGDEVSIDLESQFEVVWQPRAKVAGNFESDAIEYGFNYELKTLIGSYESSIEVVKAKTTEETIAQFEVEKAELTTKLADYEVQLQEMASLREYKVAIETQTKKDYIAKVENLEDFEKEAILVDVDKYSFAQLEEEVAKLVGKKVLKFSAEVSKPISDTNSKYTHDDKTQPVRAYEANWIKN